MENTRLPEAQQEGWSSPLPEHVAGPTYWPALLALGMTLVLLGPVTSMAISVVGACLGAVSLAKWIGDLAE